MNKKKRFSIQRKEGPSKAVVHLIVESLDPWYFFYQVSVLLIYTLVMVLDIFDCQDWRTIYE